MFSLCRGLNSLLQKQREMQYHHAAASLYYQSIMTQAFEAAAAGNKEDTFHPGLDVG
jgi:hypothetical protein